MKLLPYGPDAVLIELDELSHVEQLYAHLRFLTENQTVGGLTDLVPGARTILAIGRPGADPHMQLAQALEGWRPDAAPGGNATQQARAQHELPVRYDGPDLAAVARAAGLSVDDTIALHTASTYQVAFCGFAPGFAYLAGTPAPLRLPRRPSPRTAVPAGAVALADEFSSVYPRCSPGGWHILGSTAVRPWDPERDPPALFAPGDLVRFRACLD